jgi:microcystin-dependent protein
VSCSDTRSTITETGGPTELGIGAIADGDTLVRDGDQIVGTAAGSSSVPVGSIVLWSTTSAPTDWKLCDGTLYDMLDVPSLYAVIGTTFNTGGDAPTQCRMPNLLDRFPKGKNSDSIGATGGSTSPTISISDPGHTHNSGSLATLGPGAPIVSGVGPPPTIVDVPGDTLGGATASGLTNVTASCSDVRPPYLTLCYIIKYQ